MGLVARMGRRGVYRVLGRNLRERDNLENRSVNGKKISRWIFKRGDVGHGLDRCGSGQGQVAGTCECGNEPSGSLRCGKFLD